MSLVLHYLPVTGAPLTPQPAQLTTPPRHRSLTLSNSIRRLPSCLLPRSPALRLLISSWLLTIVPSAIAAAFRHRFGKSVESELGGEDGDRPSLLFHLPENLPSLRGSRLTSNVRRCWTPFDGSKFNFTQVGQEVIFRFEPSNDYQSRFHSCASAINVSPIEYGHVLLIPHVLDRFQQPIDAQSLLLAVCMAQEAADPFFRVGYNSLGAFATINHLHFQVLIMSFLSMLKR